ncbi:MAG: exosortase/archaeosortase family protein [Bacteroidales bacterium]
MEEEKGMYSSYFKTPLARFIIKGIVLFLLWDLVIYPYLIPGFLHSQLIGYLVGLSGIILNAFHYTVSSSNNDIFLDGIRTVHVGIPCDGIEAMGVFSCLIIAFPSGWLPKVWMILTGIVVIFLLNAVRIVVLAWLVAENHLTAFDLNHKYFFNIILYAFLLIILFLWSSGHATKKEGKHRD